ncbi:MAG: transposase [Gemmatimonadales bacterium]|nr:transposase [Gemmatimonadales bacterium]
MPALLDAEVAPLRVLLGPLNGEIVAADARLASVVAGDPVVTQLCTAPGIGPVTAVAFVATLDVVTRFKSEHQVEAYLGLTPQEYSSGERQHRGRISKTGNVRMRYLLVTHAMSYGGVADPAPCWSLKFARICPAPRAGASTTFRTFGPESATPRISERRARESRARNPIRMPGPSTPSARERDWIPSRCQ